MELYVEPSWAKKDAKFKKGYKPWNAGRKGFVTDDTEKRENMLKILAEGGRLRYVNGKSSGGRNKVAVCAYDLDGLFVRVFQSIGEAASELCLTRENIRACVANKRKRCGLFQFRKAVVLDFQGVKYVSKKKDRSIRFQR